METRPHCIAAWCNTCGGNLRVVASAVLMQLYGRETRPHCIAFYVGKPDERAPQIAANDAKSAYAD
jgi:hypothetical protein